jgi:dihydrofolate reductase
MSISPRPFVDGVTSAERIDRVRRSPETGDGAMRIVLSDFMSLDGVVQAPGGADEDRDGGFDHGGWSMPFFDPESMGAAIGEAAANTEALLFGRRTYDTMAGAWPDRAGDPFADHMNSVAKYVVSRTYTQDDLTWNNSTLLPSEDVVGAIRDLKARPGGDISLMGSTSVARLCVEHDLVDEYLLMVEPILLGGGKRIFPDDGNARPLELVSSAVASTGVIICSYRPAS